MPKYSIIIPVYNRPDEVNELLESLINQTFDDFEILIIEDGSKFKCANVVEKYTDRLDIKYYYKENTGQGFSRNYGFERAVGSWLIVFDSDCLIPEDYLEIVNKYLLDHPKVAAYGGPDSAHESFTPIQKAISYSMTSLFTTGGIRGNKKHLGAFHPRSFNMGISREVFDKTRGYVLPKKGEDIEFSIRIIENGFDTALIEKAFVYHKRRTSFWQFFKQLNFFGTARINVFRFYKKELKLIHFFPTAFTIGFIALVPLTFWLPKLALIGIGIYGIYYMLILVDAILKTRNLNIGILSVIAAFIQLTGYGLGLLKEGFVYLIKG